MSRHEGVSCDSCLKSEFRGRRYKCLICYDFDLCSACFESGVTSTRHSSVHPMQCILTRDLIDLFYGGDAASASASTAGTGGASGGHRRHGGTATSLAQAFTCPLCARLGFTEASLAEHVTSQHTDATQEVVCPICAAKPGHNPNLVTDDFSAHFTLEHRGAGPEEASHSGSSGFEAPPDLISFLNSPNGGPPSSSSRLAPQVSRPAPGAAATATARARRSAANNAAHLYPPASLMGRLAARSALAAHEAADPIAELLSQLSNVRRTASAAAASSHSSSSISSQFQQLQTQLQLERQQAQAQRQDQRASANAPPRSRLGYPQASSSAAEGENLKRDQQKVHNADPNGALASTRENQGYFLLRQGSDEESDDSSCFQAAAASRQSKSQFVQDLVLSTLVERVTLNENEASQSHAFDLM